MLVLFLSINKKQPASNVASCENNWEHEQERRKTRLCERNCFDISRELTEIGYNHAFEPNMNQISSHQSATQQQLALDIFHSMDATDTPITESGQDFHLRKSSLLVDVSDVGLLARRILNGVYFIAQHDPDAETHTHDLRYFKWLINYANSNNNTHLKRVIREAQKSAVQVNVIDAANPDEDNWVSVPMLGAAGIRKGQITFKIPSELRGQLRDPDRYSLLSMRILAGFSSIYALELYERLSVFKGDGASPWWHIDQFRELIKVDGLKSANDFRYFRRDIIQPAIDQINSISDIEVTLELKRTGRFYTHLRFMIQTSQKHMLLSSIAASKELYEVLTKEFGLSDVELDEIAKNRDVWTDDRLRETIEFVRYRCTTSKVLYPGKYLMTAIRDGYRIGSLEKKNQAAQKVVDEAKLKHDREMQAIREGKPAPVVEIPTGEALHEAWNEFRISPQAKLFKTLPASYEDANTRQKKTFEGFLHNR